MYYSKESVVVNLTGKEWFANEIAVNTCYYVDNDLDLISTILNHSVTHDSLSDDSLPEIDVVGLLRHIDQYNQLLQSRYLIERNGL